MSWSLLSLGILVYLGLMFTIAYAAEREWLPARWVKHPWVGALSLGVYATAWTYYGGVGLAARDGYLFLTIYLGATLCYLLAPTLLRPLLRLTREYQLSSLADVFAFRYPAPTTGALVTLLMLMGLLPYIALQIDAVISSTNVLIQLSQSTPLESFELEGMNQQSTLLGVVFCGMISLFTMLFGARSLASEKRGGLVLAIALESIVKLVALLLVGAYALFHILGGSGGLELWLNQHPEAISRLYAPVGGSEWSAVLLLSFSAAFMLPRQFQMLFAENLEPRGLETASWLFPLFLLLLNLPVPLILWAGQSQNLHISADYYLLALTQLESSGWLGLIVYLGGISAASAMIIVESLALATMAHNHLVLPLTLRLNTARSGDFYRTLLWSRRALIALIIFTGYGAFLVLSRAHELAHLGLISFVAVAQFLPAMLALLYWRRATHLGFLLGVSGGMVVWFIILVWPIIDPAHAPELLPDLGLDRWAQSTFWSLTINGVLFMFGSLLTPPNLLEIAADQACRLDAVLPRTALSRLRSIRQLEARIARQLGPVAARSEVARAIADLGLDANELRARQLHFLRDRIERNLSGLIGPQLAHLAVTGPSSESIDGRTPMVNRSLLVEDELENSHNRLHGLAAELNELRRFHRQVLLDLPVGVCSLGTEREVLLWNDRMTSLSGISSERALGERLNRLPAPWGQLLERFVQSGRAHEYKLKLDLPGSSHARWLNLHHETLTDSMPGPNSILLLEDLTDQQRLEAELAHSERLASIGMFAAGIAHEIGNPLTGISSLTQNLRIENDPDELKIGLDDILDQTRRITDIVRSLLNFAHAGHEQLELTELEISDCVKESIRLVRLSPTGRQMEFDTSAVESCTLLADRGRILQVCVNLLSNAADASPPGGLIRVTVHRGQHRQSSTGAAIEICTLRIADQGCGIAEAVQSKVFEPFFTTKEPGRGTGLGLPLVYSIVREHGGTVQLSSRARRSGDPPGATLKPTGTTVTVRLPIRGPHDNLNLDETNPDH